MSFPDHWENIFAGETADKSSEALCFVLLFFCFFLNRGDLCYKLSSAKHALNSSEERFKFMLKYSAER